MTLDEYKAQPKAIYKNELAEMLGYSNWRNVQQKIKQSEQLKRELERTACYSRTAHLLTPAQAKIIIRHLSNTK